MRCCIKMNIWTDGWIHTSIRNVVPLYYSLFFFAGVVIPPCVILGCLAGSVDNSLVPHQDSLGPIPSAGILDCKVVTRFHKVVFNKYSSFLHHIYKTIKLPSMSMRRFSLFKLYYRRCRIGKVYIGIIFSTIFKILDILIASWPWAKSSTNVWAEERQRCFLKSTNIIYV